MGRKTESKPQNIHPVLLKGWITSALPSTFVGFTRWLVWNYNKTLLVLSMQRNGTAAVKNTARLRSAQWIKI
jgi:hypothetical protein